jgi:hypothetical protein
MKKTITILLLAISISSFAQTKVDSTKAVKDSTVKKAAIKDSVAAKDSVKVFAIAAPEADFQMIFLLLQKGAAAILSSPIQTQQDVQIHNLLAQGYVQALSSKIFDFGALKTEVEKNMKQLQELNKFLFVEGKRNWDLLLNMLKPKDPQPK